MFLKTCSWIQLTMVKSLLLDSALREIRIRALAFSCSKASSVLSKTRNLSAITRPNGRNIQIFACGIRLFCLRIPITVCGNHLQLRNPKQLAIFACCGIRDTTNVPTKFMLHSYVRGIYGSFASGIHSHFGTCLKISF